MAYRYSYDDEKTPSRPILRTNRNVWKYLILSIITLGIYNIVFFIPFSFDLDKVAPARDRSKTINFLYVYILSLFTFNIVTWIWMYHVAGRIEDGLSERKIPHDFSRSDFWVWFILGQLFIVGPIIFLHKLCESMNILCEDYNKNPLNE